jgi:cytochrome c biogenesis protein CcmG/thiol:disulfide interchange protein DsbE
MKRYARIGAIILILPLLAGFRGKIYDFRLKDLNRKSVSFSEVEGKNLTVLDFWATWCQPCVRSIPRLVTLSKEFEARGVNFVGISVDSPRNFSKIKPFAASLGITYPVLMDPSGKLMGELNILAVPTLLIVDTDMNVVYIQEGFNAGDEQLIREEIERCLAKDPE